MQQRREEAHTLLGMLMLAPLTYLRRLGVFPLPPPVSQAKHFRVLVCTAAAAATVAGGGGDLGSNNEALQVHVDRFYEHVVCFAMQVPSYRGTGCAGFGAGHLASDRRACF